VLAAGGRLVVSRRRLSDTLYDTADERLLAAGCGLRIRRDGPATLLTYKGPVQPETVKSREEVQTLVDEPEALAVILHRLGFTPVLSMEKFREEYALASTHLAIDDTPVGVYVEIEGDESAIGHAGGLLGKSAADYCLASYAELYFS
jgi:adenylate cyclase class 2